MEKDNYGDKKPDSLLETLLAVGRVGLMLLGIIGIAYEVFRENGLLKQWLKSLFSSTGGWVSAVILAFVLYLFWRWMNAAPKGVTTRRGDIPLYAMMAIGAFFLYRLITTGSL
ncbi:MAG: hypothetical protein CVU15_03660 [Betaproteobacteria bacterium HGW-Betaproteobacteria-1]|jgi:hypothetical protein|nr:MAG: hypothetical protein CVU15_03660 [Betaproteobacteria bacterium HGW-Betaproteobacteria-1]